MRTVSASWGALIVWGGGGLGVALSMQKGIRWYVGVVVVLAVTCVAALYRFGPEPTAQDIGIAAILCALAVAGEILSFSLPHSSAGNIGFIPYFAAAVLV